jgi:sulfur carrier protein
MQVFINGKSTDLEATVTVAELLRQMNIEGKVAVEINRDIVPRSRFEQHRLNEGDTLEIVHAIGGG